MNLGKISLLALAISTPAFASDLAAKKEALIAQMNENGCQMSTPQADQQMPALGITRPEAIQISREMLAEGIAGFGADEETLLLLPPACLKED